MIFVWIQHLHALVQRQAQSERLDPLRNHRPAAKQHRLRNAVIDHGLHCAQHAVILALGIDDAA